MFIKYPKIKNSYTEAIVRRAYELVPSDVTWYAEEKIHGSNLQLWTNGNVVQFSSRKQVMEYPFDSYYNLRDTYTIFAEKAFNLWMDVSLGDVRPVSAVTIYGEYFGGKYVHSEVKLSMNSTSVQKEVQYCPHNDFILFDVVLHFSDDESKTANIHLRKVLAESAGFHLPPQISSGTFEEMLAVENDGLTRVPQMYGLPPIEGNIMEGVVIRPEHPFVYGNGEPVIFKNKNEKFNEKTRPPKVITPDSGPLAAVKVELGAYINENRLNALASKLGGLRRADVGPTIGMFVKDAMEDFLEDSPDVLAVLEKAEKKLLNKWASRECAQLILKNLKD